MKRERLSSYFLLFVKYIWVFLILAGYSTVLASDGQNTYKTKYITVHYSEEKDLDNFSRKVNGLGFFGFFSKKSRSSLKDRLDEIVEKVQNILDLHPPKLHFDIFIRRKYADVEKKYRKLFVTGKSPIAFYHHKTKAITLSIDHIKNNVLAHEIGHAVISIYFVVALPERIQEIITQYIDVHLED